MQTELDKDKTKGKLSYYYYYYFLQETRPYYVHIALWVGDP